MPHPNKRIGVCDRCDDDTKLFLQDIHNDVLFNVMNNQHESPRAPFDRRALFCRACLAWAKRAKDCDEDMHRIGNQYEHNPARQLNPSTPTSELSAVDGDITQMAKTYTMTITTNTGLDSLNMRTVTISPSNPNTDTIIRPNSPLDLNVQTAPTYEDISEPDSDSLSSDRNLVSMLADSISDAQKFTNKILNSGVDPMLTPTEESVDNVLDPLDLIQRIEPLLTIEPVYSPEDDIGLIDPCELNQYIEPIPAFEPPNEFADAPIEPAEQPTIEQAGVHRIQRDESDDPLDDSVPGEYFDC